jgi:hypothetical protein
MNRLIKLFQAKANGAWDKYLEERRATTSKEEINSPAWQLSIVIATKWKTQAETWEHAAKLLRQEELNR